MQQLTTLQSKLAGAIKDFQEKYESFDDAISSYTAQYGDGAVKVYEPFKISGTIDPVIIILGRTTPLFYRDSKRLLSGSLSSIMIDVGNVYILGRREPPDSKLLIWSPKAENEIEHYDSRVRIIPSRIHAAIFALESGEVSFADLGSTSGSILAGESAKPEPFIRLYATPRVDIQRVTIDAKYALARKS
jgi:hypothetical protein